jgi:ATP-binding cassette subfamily B protein
MIIPGGSKIGIVGDSGSGKTTLAKLLLRLYPHDKGEITINGCNIQDIDLDHLRNRVVYIPQSIFLFSGSIAENLRFCARGAKMDELVDACIKAQAHGFINELPLRYNTYLDENGSNLSGGQRQRIAIAQAILRNPDILVMDEAAANLDPGTEKAIGQMIFDEFRDTTVIMITHRLVSVANYDCVFVMEAGRIIELGTHNELMASRGKYYELWCSQMHTE